MLDARSLDHIFHVHRPAAAGVERAYSGLKIDAERSNLFDVRKELAADLLLVGFGQRRDFLDGVLKQLYHSTDYSTLAPRSHQGEVRNGAVEINNLRRQAETLASTLSLAMADRRSCGPTRFL
jgi:hypothetical protein